MEYYKIENIYNIWFWAGNKWQHPVELSTEFSPNGLAIFDDDTVCAAEQTWAMWQGLTELDDTPKTLKEVNDFNERSR